jgi:hypothetical protein
MPNHTGIAVIESKWFEGSNVSVRGLFDLVADLATDTPHGYHYEMASSEAALKEAIPRIAKDNTCRYLCLAMHGNRKGLQLINGDQVTRTELKNMLVRIRGQRGAKLAGIHMASCIFGTQEIAEKLFSTPTELRWMAGYTETVDWIESSALDLLFFNYLADLDDMPLTEIQKIHAVARNLKKNVSGLVEKLGFGIYVRKQKTGGGKNLMLPA